jgi:DNA-binding response OmpR family regulator
MISESIRCPHTQAGLDLEHFENSTPDIAVIHTVLVVDDAGVVRRLSFRILSAAGYRVFEAASAGEALEVIRMLNGHVDLVLVDVVMPEVNGVDLVRMIRERWSQPAILFMSAYPAEVLAEHGLQDLEVLFLAKPYTMEELRAKVREAMDRPPSPREDPVWRARHQ